MADYSQCMFVGGWTDEQDIKNNFNLIPSDEQFFLVNKFYSEFAGCSGILVYKQYGYYAYGVRDISTAYDQPVNFQLNYTTQTSIINYFQSEFGGGVYISNLTEEEKNQFFDLLQNN